ncbi:MAG: flagellar motor switch protein FliN [candidate division Zixibacteria bacterium HGW-Zixibacteria-1]|nr:MAG: flagellar motor switch protein FliN [candidate division Zixibacteria bacterium HGW-Zixibacteria-1]
MDEKNGIELPMNGSPSDEAAGGKGIPPENMAETPDSGLPAADQGAAKGDSIDMPDEGGDNEPDGADLLSTEDVESAMQRAVEEELTLNGLNASEGQPVIKQADFQQLSADSEQHGSRNIELLMDVELPVSIELGRTRMNISDILSLGPGSIVELDKLVGEPVDLLVNQKKVARGEVVVVEENFGLRITQLISPEERLKNLQ